MSEQPNQDIISKVEKLLRLAGKNTNEAEAAAATQKAMDLLAAYNLDLSSINEEGDSGKRSEEKLIGGFYEYEQNVWRYVADLNFCFYWSQKTWVKREKKDAKSERILDYYRRDNILRSQHKLVGRTVNVAATKAMSQYLLGAIERLTRERLMDRINGQPDYMKASINRELRSRWAVSYREGMAARICEKLWDRRQDQLRSEEQKQREAEARAAMAGVSSQTGITLASLRKSEEEANADFMYGDGWSAKQAARRAERARAAAEAEAAAIQWAMDHPEEAAKEAAEELKRERKRGSGGRSRGGPAPKERDWSAYSAGYDKGDSVGLDVQTSSRSSGAGIGHTKGLLS